MLKENSICFTGHRKIPDERIENIRSALSENIEDLILKGYTYFLAGGALGFDTMAAEAVLELREKYPEVKLKLVLPCLSQTNGWSIEDKIKYDDIKEKADEVHYTSMSYYRGCMHTRNRYLVDNASLCIAYYRRSGSGTAYTVNYAELSKIQVINLAQDEN